MTNDQIEAIIRTTVPEYNTTSKVGSKLMDFITWLNTLLGNTNFATSVWTTIGYTTYCPTQPTDWITLAHEGKHALQGKKLTRVLMSFLYMLPISLVPLILIAAIALPFFGFGLWLIPLILLMALCLAPIPSYFKARFEMEAYTVTLACYTWVNGAKATYDLIPWLTGMFTGPQYYYMWNFGTSVEAKIESIVSSIQTGAILNDDPYLQAIYAELVSQGALYKGS